LNSVGLLPVSLKLVFDQLNITKQLQTSRKASFRGNNSYFTSVHVVGEDEVGEASADEEDDGNVCHRLLRLYSRSQLSICAFLLYLVAHNMLNDEDRGAPSCNDLVNLLYTVISRNSNDNNNHGSATIGREKQIKIASLLDCLRHMLALEVTHFLGEALFDEHCGKEQGSNDSVCSDVLSDAQRMCLKSVVLRAAMLKVLIKLL